MKPGEQITYLSAAELHGAVSFSPGRGIGVTVGEPFFHRGMDEMMVDCSYEYPEIITAGAQGAKPVAEWPAVAHWMTEATIAKIDACIAELSAHRARLGAELDRLALEQAGRAA